MTENVLGRIVDRKRIDVAERLEGVTLDTLRAQAEPTTRGLAEALARPGARFVMEVKRVSPSEGALRPDADPAALARAYRGAADGISVLTDGPYFGGSFDDLRAVRAVFDGPVLAKDFVVDPRQVLEARINGADAILVMLSVLDDAAAMTVIEEARRFGMDALVETHDENEVRRAVALGARIIGINNRDLRTLKVDLSTTERLAHLIPADRVAISESGIAGPVDVDRLRGHVDAFLVGSSLMKADDPAAAARALAYGRVKVCGITAAEDVALIHASGASYGGIIMVPGSPRFVDFTRAQELAREARDIGLPLVGVFRDEKVMQVAHAARALGLAAVQLHGEEDAGYMRGLRAMLPDTVELWAAGAVGADLPEPRTGADRTLYDTKVDGRSGGTGVAFEWAMLGRAGSIDRSVVAGGLRPANARAARGIGAYALDVSSGIEAAPGRKDPEKVRAFFDALRLPVRGENPSCA